MLNLFKKKDKSTEHTQELEVLHTLNRRLVMLEGRISSLEVSNDTFRDKVLRKIQKSQEKEQVCNTSFPARPLGFRRRHNGMDTTTP